MRILEVDIPKSSPNHDGLEHIKMERLGAVVLIAGKNGSGKTRILNKIFQTLAIKPTKQQIDNEIPQLGENKRRLNAHEEGVANLKEAISKATNPQELESLNNRLIADSQLIDHLKFNNKIFEDRISWKPIITDVLAEKYDSIHFVPKDLGLADPRNFNKNDVINFANLISIVGLSNVPRGTFSKIQTIQDRWFNTTHQNSTALDGEKKSAIEEYEKLNQIIEIFLNTRIGRTIDGEATLFSLPISGSNLSDGQKILIQFCLAIYSQETELKNLILIMDEPENHLHPSAIIEIIARIQGCVSNGQIWIATHSIPLLAHFDPSQIWYVENNEIQHAGKIPEKVLHSLLGDDNSIAKLQDFIGLPAQYATSRYAFECLIEPAVVQTGSNDPQSMQIRDDLLNISTNNNLRVLDYGVGKGRLISNLADLDVQSAEKIIGCLDYIAFDKFPKDKAYCETSLAKAYGNPNNRYFNDFNKLLSVYDQESFDVVIMCNVLHEIDPKEWLKLFGREGSITNLLKSNGVLLLVEDHEIPIGEKAYQKGFLVLDTPQLKNLFKITEQDKNFFHSERKKGRLKAHHIPKEILTRIDEASRTLALRSLSTLAREKILEIRSEPPDYQKGKLHGFWTQQFANAQLNLSEFTTQ